MVIGTEYDVYPVRVFVDRRLWPVTWYFEGRTPQDALISAMEYAEKILVPCSRVLLRAEDVAMFRVLPDDPEYVPAD